MAAPKLKICQKYGFWPPEADIMNTFTRNYEIARVHHVGFRWPKTTILGANFDFWGLLYRLLFTNEGQIWYAIADPWYMLTSQIYCLPIVLTAALKINTFKKHLSSELELDAVKFKVSQL